MVIRKRRHDARIPRHHHQEDDCDDVQYVATGCHLATATSGTAGKRVGYCDCAWPQPQNLVHRTNLIWQTPETEEMSPTLAGNSKTIYCRRTTSASPQKSAANTPDLFVDARPEALATSSSNMAETTGRTKTSTHLYESPMFSHLDRLLH